VFPFTDGGQPCDALAHAAELAFAARATSSFPGAFPPFTVAELDRVLAERGRAWPGRRAFLHRVLPRQAAAGAADTAVLIDGSVLANAPFRPAIDALAERPARRRVDRRFVYIDPFPGVKFKLAGGGAAGALPGFFQTILGAVSELPRKQPIRDNLEAIAARSARIERMRQVTAGIRGEVEGEIERLFGYTLFLDRPTPARLAAWRARAQEGAAAKSGYGYAAYGHVKFAGVVEWITALLYHVGGEPGRWERIRAAIAAAIAERGYDAVGPLFAGGTGPKTIEFLRRYDLGFRIRRLRLLARRGAELEEGDAPAAVEGLRDAVYGALAGYLEAKRTGHHARLRGEVRSLRGDAGPLLDALADSLDLKPLDDGTDEALAAALTALPKEQRRPILLAYLGFPFFDVATLPLLQGEGLDEFDPIKVDRIAPDDARAIRAGGAEATLKGIQFNSFGAFFSRRYRENDYLWGRLHGAERMIDIIVSALPGPGRLKPGRVAAIKRAAFHAVLDEEEPRLLAIAPLIAQLRGEIG
jgi:patatin-related protein